MGDHEVVMLHTVGWVPVNGHEPMVCHNVTTRRGNVHCETCGWISRDRSVRHWHLLEREWRTHAGDIAVGLTITHGAPGAQCHCVTCLIAERDRRRAAQAQGFTAVNLAGAGVAR